MNLHDVITRTKRPDALGDGAPVPQAPQEAALAEMSFLDHLEELRWRIFKGLSGVLVGAIVAAFFAEFFIEDVLLAPTRADFFMYKLLRIDAQALVLQSRTLPGQFFAYWGTVLVVGIILGMPILLYHLWKFVEPGLYPHEKEGTRFAAVFAAFFFFVGVAFAYLILTPTAVQFFAQFVLSENVINEFDILNYFSTITMWALGAGLLFELPVVIYFLSKLRILNPVILRKGRRWAVVIILVISAVLTPPDPISQIIMGIPLLGLYELSIWISAVVNRREQKRVQKALE